MKILNQFFIVETKKQALQLGELLMQGWTIHMNVSFPKFIMVWLKKEHGEENK